MFKADMFFDQVLSLDERNRIFNLLRTGSSLFQALDPKARQNALVVAGLGTIKTVYFAADTLDYENGVWSALSTLHVPYNGYQTLALIVLLEHLLNVEYSNSAPGEDQDRRTFFQDVIDRYWQWRNQGGLPDKGITDLAPDRQMPGHGSLTGEQAAIAAQLDRLLEQQRVVQAPVVSRKLDEKIVTDFDLRELEDEFLHKLTHSGAIGLSTGGYNDQSFLEQYIVPRLLRALQSERRKEPTRFPHIRLNQEDLNLSAAQVVERAILRQTRYSQLVEILDKNPGVDIILVVLNNKVPVEDMERFATAFWQVVGDLRLPDRLKQERRLLLLIWANVRDRPLRGSCFVELPTVSQFSEQELSDWLNSKLAEAGLSQAEIAGYLQRITELGGDPVDTYNEMYRTYKLLSEGRN